MNSNTKANLTHKGAREKKKQLDPTPNSIRELIKIRADLKGNRDQKKCGTDQQNQELVL